MDFSTPENIKDTLDTNKKHPKLIFILFINKWDFCCKD